MNAICGICILKVNIQVPTVGQSEAMQQDLTKQGNELQEKLKYLDSLKFEATPIIKNVAELDYHKLKGKPLSNKGGQPYLVLPLGILKLYFMKHTCIHLNLFSYVLIAYSQNITASQVYFSIKQWFSNQQLS